MDLIELNHDLGSQIHQLEEAVHSNGRIGIAMGLLMAQYDTDADDAFATLKRASQDSNRRLRDTAEDVIASRRLPLTRALRRPARAGELRRTSHG